MQPPTTQALALVALLLAVTALPLATLCAQESPVIPPAPLEAGQPAPVAPGPGAATELAARRALEIGLPSIAADIYRRLLDDTTLAPETRNRIILARTTALIEDDRIDEAAETLQHHTDPDAPERLLRQALIDTRAGRHDEARATAATLAPGDLPPADRAWLHYLRGILAAEARDDAQALRHYQQAEAETISPEQRAWFALARVRVQLHLGQATESAINTLRQTIERYPGRTNAHDAVGSLAVALNATARRADAITLLQTQIQFLAPQETEVRDRWRLLLGLIAGPDDNTGRDALRKLLAGSDDRDKQRAALRLLANASQTKERAAEFHNWLNQLIDATPPHPILGELLLFRAQLALSGTTEKDYLAAENDANRLLAEFPGSLLRPAALGVQTAIAWEQGRYRAAADWATRARAELRTGITHAQLGVLIAESFYRAKDYRNASDAYGSALADVPEGVAPGMLMFQRVLSEMQSGANGNALDSAEKILDTYAADPRFDTVSRWHAEWNLVRALQSAGSTAQAYARINRLLAGAPAPDSSGDPQSNLPADLRARMAWLQMRLAYDSGNYRQTIAHGEALKTTLADVTPELQSDIISMALLLEVEAGYALARPGQPAGIDTAELLRTLRADYPKSAAAIRSYIVEADEAAKRDQLVEAQGLLRKLADDYRGTPYASYALYQAAIYAESRAQDQYYREAYKMLEELVIGDPKGELVFYARLKQGNLLRKLNDYGLALNVYNNLVNHYKYPEYREGLVAELALADCYAALAASDVSYAESAATIYERLLDMPAADIDLRVEAGYKFGRHLIARNTLARLETIWWQMINDFLLDEARSAKLGSNGRYWLSRTLLDLGEALERQSKNPQAREAYQLIITKNLPGAALAQERITRGSG